MSSECHFLGLACRAFNVYNNSMVRLTFTAVPPGLFYRAPRNPSLFRPFRRFRLRAKTIQEDTAMIAR